MKFLSIVSVLLVAALGQGVNAEEEVAPQKNNLRALQFAQGSASAVASGGSSSASSSATAISSGFGSAFASGSASAHSSGGWWGGSSASASSSAFAGGFGFGGAYAYGSAIAAPLAYPNLYVPNFAYWQTRPLHTGVFWNNQNIYHDIHGNGRRSHCYNGHCTTIIYHNGRIVRQHEWQDNWTQDRDDPRDEYTGIPHIPATGPPVIRTDNPGEGEIRINTKFGYRILAMPQAPPVKRVEDLKNRFVPVVLQNVRFPGVEGPYDCTHFVGVGEEMAGLPGTLNVGRDDKHRPILGYMVSDITYPGYHCVHNEDDKKPQFAFSDIGTGSRYVVEHGNNGVIIN